jgi:hypothetical protein
MVKTGPILAYHYTPRPRRGLCFHRASTLARLHLSLTFGLHTADNQPQNAAATISATPQIASASHIVVTFNFRFCAHNGLKSDIAPCPKRAKNGSGHAQRLLAL